MKIVTQGGGFTSPAVKENNGLYTLKDAVDAKDANTSDWANVFAGSLYRFRTVVFGALHSSLSQLSSIVPLFRGGSATV